MTKRLLGLVLTLAMVSGCGEQHETTIPTAVPLTDEAPIDSLHSLSPDGQQIAFWRRDGQAWSLWMAGHDMSSPRKLAAMASFPTPPRWVPGTHDVVVTARGTNPFDVLLVKGGGDSARALVESATFKLPTGFTAEGSEVVFGTYSPGGTVQTYSVNLQGGEPRRLFTKLPGTIIGTPAPSGMGWAMQTWDGGRFRVMAASDADGDSVLLMTEAGYESLEQFEAPAIWAPDGQHFIFSSFESGKPDIWIGGLDGSTRQLTSDINSDASAAWSPDGRWIAFLSDRGRQTDIWVVPSAGGDAIRVTDDDLVEESPFWLSDTEIAFASNRSTGRLTSISLSDGEEKGLTSDSTNVTRFWSSPDGTTLAFTTRRTGGTDELSVLAATGGSPTEVAIGQFINNVLWSPGGDSLVFSAGTPADLWLFDLRSREKRQLSDWPGSESAVQWPDSNEGLLVYANRESRQGDLWTIPLSGGTGRRLTQLHVILQASVQKYGAARDTFAFTTDSASGNFGLYRIRSGQLEKYSDAWWGFLTNDASGRTAVGVPLSDSAGRGEVRDYSGKLLRTLEPQDQLAAFSTDGSKLLLRARDPGGDNITMLDIDSGTRTVASASADEEAGAEFGPGDSTVVVLRRKSIGRMYKVDVSGLLNAAGRSAKP